MPLVINSQNKVIKTTKQGLEVFVVLFRGVVSGQFLCVRHANSALITLDNKAK